MFAKKSLGQHFLMHPRIAERIAAAAHLTKKDTVLEIGPGTGILTEPLLARAKKVIAVETDAELVKKLHERFAKEIAGGTLTLLTQDIQTFNPLCINEPYTLVANIPYFLTGKIIRMFLETAHPPRALTLLVQKEVAARIAREKKESLLSLSVKAYGVPKYLFTVPRGAFIPAPSVDSAVLQVASIQNPFADEEEKHQFFSLLHTGFAHKRKRLAKNLEEILKKDVVLGVLAAAEIDSGVRAEEVALDAWMRLAAHTKTLRLY